MAIQLPLQTKILQTVVTPNENGAVVQLQISDGSLDAEYAAIRLTLAVQVPEYDVPLLAHLQREAMAIAREALLALERALGQEIQSDMHRDLRPKIKK